MSKIHVPKKPLPKKAGVSAGPVNNGMVAENKAAASEFADFTDIQDQIPGRVEPHCIYVALKFQRR